MHPKRLFALMVIANQLAHRIHQAVQREKRNGLRIRFNSPGCDVPRMVMMLGYQMVGKPTRFHCDIAADNRNCPNTGSEEDKNSRNKERHSPQDED